MAVAAWPWLLLVVRRARWARPGAPLQQPDNSGSVGAPETQGLLPPDLAVPLAKSLGLVVISYATWLLGFAGVPFVSATVWAVWAVVGVAGFALAQTKPADLFRLLRQRRRAVLIGEAVFLAVFLSLCRVRALTPDATFRYDERGRDYDGSASEKFTNLALLNSLYRERHMPPRDTWLAGYPINYYYFGHFEWATFCKMSFIPPRIAFNIGQAAVFALVAANAFSLALHLTRRVGAGLLAAYAVTIMGSPYGFLQLLIQGVRNYQYWEASRIVEGTIIGDQIAGPITEFPFFTFVVGDFHAHGISFHSYLLALAIAFLCPLAENKSAPSIPSVSSIPSIGLPMALATLLLALLLAATAMTNTWDAPSLGLLIAAILVVRSAGRGEGKWLRGILPPLLIAGGVAVLAWVFLLPHLRTFEVPVGVQRDPRAFYLGPLKWLGSSHLSDFKDYMVHFGFLVVPLTVAIHLRLAQHVAQCEEKRRRRRQNLLGLSYLAALYVFLFEQRHFLLFFLAAMILYAGALVAAELRAANESPTSGGRDAFVGVGVLTAVAFFLSLFAEVWVVEDGYAGAFERYNTVFKAYNICWLLFGVSAAAAVAMLLPRLQGGWRRLGQARILWPWAALAAVLLMGFVYPCAATLARESELTQRVRFHERIALPNGPALDAVRYYASVNRDEYRLIEWINETVAGKPVIAEACVGTSAYTVQSRIATLTGVCTVLAWPQHEANWRSQVRSSQNPARRVPIWTEMSRRINDLASLYQMRDEKAARAIISTYNIDYILIGKLEIARYGPSCGQYLRQLFRSAFQSGDTILLKTDRGG